MEEGIFFQEGAWPLEISLRATHLYHNTTKCFNIGSLLEKTFSLRPVNGEPTRGSENPAQPRKRRNATVRAAAEAVVDE